MPDTRYRASIIVRFGALAGCGDPSIGPVLGGIDLVALYNAPTSIPVNGSTEFEDSLGSYVFRFTNQAPLLKHAFHLHRDVEPLHSCKPL